MNSAVFTDVYHLFSIEPGSIGNIKNLVKNIVEGKIELNTVSYVTEDNNKNVYIVDNYGKTIYKTDHDGRIISSATVIKDNRRTYCNSLTADKSGNIYILVTVLDTYGLYVDEEEILKYSPQGKFEKAVYKVQYEKGSKPKRIGRIKELKTDENYLYFNYILDNKRVNFERIKLDGNTAETFYTLNFDEDKYISNITRTDNESILYSTKSGRMYKSDKNGQSSLVYSGSSLYNNELSLLSHFQQYGDGLFFIDFYKHGIIKVNLDNPGIVSEFTEKLKSYDKAFSEEPNNLQGLYAAQEGRVITYTENKVFFINTDGSIYKRIDTLQIPAGKLTAFWIFCLVVLLLVVVLIDLLRVIYIYFMKRKISLILKEILIFIPIVIIVTGFLIDRIEYRFNIEIEDEMHNKLNIIAITATKFIDGDKFENINSPDDCMSENYKEAVNSIVQVFTSREDSPNDGLYNTLYRVKNGKVYYVMDDDDGRLYFEPLDPQSEGYKEMYDEVVDRGGLHFDGAVCDNTGEWIDVMAPIYNWKGEVVGIYETGMDYTSFINEKNERLAKNLIDIILASAINIIAFFIITFSVLSTIKTLRKGVNEIAVGNWDTVVTVKSNDEVASLCEGFNTMAQYIRDSVSEIMKMNEAYFNFVPQQFLKLLEKDSIYKIKLGDSMKKDMSIMYSSIRSFQQLLQDNTPEENFNFINSYLSRFGPIIRDNNGIIEKYLGMDILALFPQNASDGLNAAVKMAEELVLYNKMHESTGQIPVEIGIGIYYGPLMVGIIGEEKRLEGTVLSDKGNTSEILTGLTERLSAQIIITDSILKNIKDSSCYKYRVLGFIVLPGKMEKVYIYDVYQSDNDHIKELKDKTKRVFEEGIRLYQEGHFYDSRERFVEVIKQNEYDKAAKLYFYLSDDYYRKGAPDNWDGSLNI